MAKSEKSKAAEKARAATAKVDGKAKKSARPKPTGDATVEGVKAAAGVVKGKVEKAAGKVTGNKKLQAKGQADETGAKGYGKAQKARKKLG